MLESFLAWILSNVSRRPRLLLHIVVTFTILVILRLFGVYLPYNIAYLLGLREVIPQRGEVTIASDLTIAVSSLFVYLILTIIIYYVIDKALKKAFEGIDLRKPFNAIDRIRSSCFVKDVITVYREEKAKKLWGRLVILSLFSIAITLSYYSSILFLLYALNDSLELMKISLLTLLITWPITIFAIISLNLLIIILVLMVPLWQERNMKKVGSKSIFEEWFEDVIFRYLFKNCIGKYGSNILMSLAPLTPKYRIPYLRYFTIAIPHDTAKVRFNLFADSKRSLFLIVGYERFGKCIERIVSLEDLRRGMFKNLCMAKLYERTGNEWRFLGLLIAFSTVLIMGQRPALRVISEHRAIVSMKQEEKHTYVAILALDPSASEFIIRLVTG